MNQYHSWSKLFSRFGKIFKISDQSISGDVSVDTLRDIRVSMAKDLLIEFVVSWNDSDISITNFKNSNAISEDSREIDSRWALVAISQKYFLENNCDFFNLIDVLRNGEKFYEKEFNSLLSKITISSYELSFFKVKRRDFSNQKPK